MNPSVSKLTAPLNQGEQLPKAPPLSQGRCPKGAEGYD